ncbi:hypothetical protein G6M02_00025 [Agrobacterium rhizogenes]|nr:hypothetical protein [Rhizobium rhizogenes]
MNTAFLASRDNIVSGASFTVVPAPVMGAPLYVEFPDNNRKSGMITEVTASSLSIEIEGQIFRLRPWNPSDDPVPDFPGGAKWTMI